MTTKRITEFPRAKEISLPELHTRDEPFTSIPQYSFLHSICLFVCCSFLHARKQTPDACETPPPRSRPFFIIIFDLTNLITRHINLNLDWCFFVALGIHE